jgi:Lysyl oxidase
MEFRWALRRLGRLAAPTVAGGPAFGGVAMATQHRLRSRSLAFALVLLLIALGAALVPVRTMAAVDLLPALAPVPVDNAVGLNDNDVVQDPNTGQFWLQFTGSPANYGAGPLEVVGLRDKVDVATIDPDNDVMPAYQRIYRSDGTTYDVQVGELRYHPLHHHWHFEQAVGYRLLDAQGNVLGDHPKQDFCLGNVTAIDLSLPGAPTGGGLGYEMCVQNPYASFVKMGISVGWADVYDKSLTGQAFDVTSLMSQPPKLYTLQMTTNPQNRIVETTSTHPRTVSTQVLLGLGVPYKVGQPRPGI